MDQAFVEDAQHQVDRQERGGDEDRLVGQGGLEGLGGAHEAAADGGREPDLLLGLVDGRDRVAQGHAHGQVEGDGDRGQLALVVDRQGGVLQLVVGEGGERHQRPLGRPDVDGVQGVGVLPVLGRHFHDHVVLVERGIHGGHLALAECVVECVVDELRRDAETRGRPTVVLNHGLSATVLLIAAHVGNDRNRLELFDHHGGKPVEIVQIVALHGELILRVALAAADAQVLRGL